MITAGSFTLAGPFPWVVREKAGAVNNKPSDKGGANEAAHELSKEIASICPVLADNVNRV